MFRFFAGVLSRPTNFTHLRPSLTLVDYCPLYTTENIATIQCFPPVLLFFYGLYTL
jgi:hypothetical protein